MKAVLQKVNWARVLVDGQIVSEISTGVLALVGIKTTDTEKDLNYIADKIANARIFEEGDKFFDKSLLDTAYELLIVSQFTLYGDLKKGRRPSFSEAQTPQIAKNMYNNFVLACKNIGLNVKEGVFQAEMQIELSNHGPVTLILES